MNLQSMTDFVLEELKYKQSKYYEYDSNDNDKSLLKIENYAKFLKQTLTLGMFVPCDESGNFLNKNNVSFDWYTDPKIEVSEIWLKAKEKVLFRTKFKMDEENAKYLLLTFETIDNLVQLYDFELTESALKQIGL